MSFNGVLLVDKPTGITSHDVVAFLRRRLKMKEVGHAGTLDPMAEGLLVCLLGEATKLSDFLLNENKSYLAKVKFGIRTDTLDLEGQVLEEGPVNLVRPQVEMAAKSLQGEFNWPVPIYSAVKKDGKKLYEHARQNEDVELPIRAMRFEQVQIKAVELPTCDVEITCSKGSFIRTWASQLGTKLATPSVLAGLRRLKSDPFEVSMAMTMADLESKPDDQIQSSAAYIPFDRCLSNLKGLSLRGRDLKLVQNGQIPHDLERRLVPDQRQLNESGGETYVRILDGETGLLNAIIHLKSQVAPKIRRVFKRS